MGSLDAAVNVACDPLSCGKVRSSWQHDPCLCHVKGLKGVTESDVKYEQRGERLMTCSDAVSISWYRLRAIGNWDLLVTFACYLAITCCFVMLFSYL